MVNEKARGFVETVYGPKSVGHGLMMVVLDCIWFGKIRCLSDLLN